MPCSKIKRGLILFAVVFIAGAYSQALASQDHATVSPPIQAAQKPENSDKPSNSSPSQQPSAISFPPNINVMVSGKLDSVSNVTELNADEKKDKRFSEFFNVKITDIAVVIFTAFIAWFTLGLKNATIGLFNSTAELVKGAEKNAERQLRAYVFIGSRNQRINQHSRQLKFSISIKNFGSTPGYHGIIETYMGVDEYPCTNKEPPKTVKLPTEFLEFPPSELINVTTDIPIDITEAQETAIKEGEAAIYIFGVIKYTDVFKAGQRTEFRLMYSAECIQSGELHGCKYGNSSKH